MTSKSSPVHPGRVLYERAMQPLGVSRNKLARDIDVPVGRISDIVSGKRGITPDTALRLSKYFGTDAELWMRLQTDYDLEVARTTIWAEVEPRVRAFEPAAGQPAAEPVVPETVAPEPVEPEPVAAEPVAAEPLAPEPDPVAPEPVVSDPELAADTAAEPEIAVDSASQTAASPVDHDPISEDAPIFKDSYLPWAPEIGENSEESLDIPELEDSPFPVDPLK
jgi:antitoxin HigA-1